MVMILPPSSISTECFCMLRAAREASRSMGWSSAGRFRRCPPRACPQIRRSRAVVAAWTADVRRGSVWSGRGERGTEGVKEGKRSGRHRWCRPLWNSGLLTDVQLVGQGAVLVHVLRADVLEQLLALGDHQQQPAAAVVVLLVALEVLGQVVDALGEQGDLHGRRAGVLLGAAEILDDLRLALFADGGRGAHGTRALLLVASGVGEETRDGVRVIARPRRGGRDASKEGGGGKGNVH